MSNSNNDSKPLVETPTLKRRLICMVYEAFLFVAVEMFALLIFLMIAQKVAPGSVEHGRQFVFMLVAAAYFIYAWSGSGHTLAMKTWRIKVVKVGYAKVPLMSAAKRFVYAWGWFMPALVVCYAFSLHDKAQVGTAVAINILAWGLGAFLDKDRQFLHDRFAGTRLILLPKAQKKTAAKAA
jgi:uncharacterized RDD family membrane protein YckC